MMIVLELMEHQIETLPSDVKILILTVGQILRMNMSMIRVSGKTPTGMVMAMS